jgi:hypothetical protein
LDAGGAITGESNCSTETAAEGIEEESENIDVLADASLSSASSELSSALSAVLSASPGIRLCLANLGARSESFTGRGAASTCERPKWWANAGFSTGGGVGFAVVGVECGESGSVVEITGISIPSYIVRCVSR